MDQMKKELIEMIAGISDINTVVPVLILCIHEDTPQYLYHLSLLSSQ